MKRRDLIWPAVIVAGLLLVLALDDWDVSKTFDGFAVIFWGAVAPIFLMVAFVAAGQLCVTSMRDKKHYFEDNSEVWEKLRENDPTLYLIRKDEWRDYKIARIKVIFFFVLAAGILVLNFLYFYSGFGAEMVERFR